jgi:hypothetical protein
MREFAATAGALRRVQRESDERQWQQEQEDCAAAEALLVELCEQSDLLVCARFDVAKFKAKAELVAKDDSDYLKIHDPGGKQLLYEVNLPDYDDPTYVAIAGDAKELSNSAKSGRNRILSFAAQSSRAGIFPNLRATSPQCQPCSVAKLLPT